MASTIAKQTFWGIPIQLGESRYMYLCLGGHAHGERPAGLQCPVELPKLRFHDLRHTSITQLAECGVAISVIEAIAGHLSPEMVKHYTHIRAKAKAAAVAQLGVLTSPAAAEREPSAPTKAPRAS